MASLACELALFSPCVLYVGGSSGNSTVEAWLWEFSVCEQS